MQVPKKWCKHVCLCVSVLFLCVPVCTCMLARLVCDRNIDHRREEYGPPEEEWCNKAQTPAKSHEDRPEMMMMAPSNLMGGWEWKKRGREELLWAWAVEAKQRVPSRQTGLIGAITLLHITFCNMADLNYDLNMSQRTLASWFTSPSQVPPPNMLHLWKAWHQLFFFFFFYLSTLSVFMLGMLMPRQPLLLPLSPLCLFHTLPPSLHPSRYP